jgi:TRAP-type mannitol/chloroaromatic compound transport system permease small subunit
MQIDEYVGKTFSWLIIVLTVMVVIEVILRYVFNSPTVCCS